jgi:hypothetical protein
LCCRGIALEQLGRVVDAKEVLLVGLALDPDGPHHLDLQDAIYRCAAAINFSMLMLFQTGSSFFKS